MTSFLFGVGGVEERLDSLNNLKKAYPHKRRTQIGWFGNNAIDLCCQFVHRPALYEEVYTFSAQEVGWPV